MLKTDKWVVQMSFGTIICRTNELPLNNVYEA